DVAALGHRIRPMQLAKQRGVVGVVLHARHVGDGAHGVVGVVDEAVQADQRDLVAKGERPARQADGGVVVLLGGDVIDDESELEGSIAHATASRADGGWDWYRSWTPMPRQASSTLSKPSAQA